jgi:4-amino-4-deoxychorismate lyase
VLVNGIANQQLQSNDRGLSYGDGLFETIQVQNNEPLLWQAHLKRMRLGAQRLGITFDDLTVQAFKDDFKVLNSDCMGSGVLKLTLTRGVGKRGYKAEPDTKATRISMFSAMPDMSKQQADGISVVLCSTQLARQPQLAGLKHLNRLEQVLARNEWDDPKITEGIVCDTDNNVIEGCMSNLFWVKKGTVYTPDLSFSGVDGVIRNTVIKICTEQLASPVKIANFKLPDLLASDEVFVCNSLFNILPVIEIKSAEHSTKSQELSIGLTTKKLQALVQQFYLRKDSL